MAQSAEPGIVGSGPAITKLKQQIRQYADAPFPVLIEGESGSGKELVAASLHRQSARAMKPYLALNCAAISPNLVEATLFGHAKGAFTGATTARAGYFEDARDGTLFLDEIGELPLELQAKLLRVLENGEYQRVGETQSRHSQARVIAATNRDLRQEVKAGALPRGPLSSAERIHGIGAPAARSGRGQAAAARAFLRVLREADRGSAGSLWMRAPSSSGWTTPFRATCANCATS